MATGFFVGLITLDCIYRVDHVPSSDEKIVAEESLLVAGGPATNAAIAFAALGNRARLAGALGQHPLADLIRADLATCDIEVVDLTPQLRSPPPLSTILVTAATGDRAVVSRNAVGRQATHATIPDLLTDVDIVLIDGHQMAASHTVTIAAQSSAIPIVIDAGSWKPGFDSVLPLATSVIAAAKFQLPGQADTLAALSALGIAEVATTHGPSPVQFRDRDTVGTLPVPQVPVQDTLGAGDIFHGAFCHYRLQVPFPDALTHAAQIAAQSCRHFGPRTWIENAPHQL
ncbi:MULTISPECIES: PfkB family carbohydrate kinase [Cyanophyceae]|uniref:PfkB family carbohydrate kinase n=1 Tax=Leptolyngbya subtilissima DQ-A4 TaxID=2933933 RepID=A0ABV0K9F2_9CYAN|nr:PfkB family carbohydrate kinase [Nodosilinea sp. FACHB-141]MBD2114262.1 sugar kinase [Nodosilinea sp. FACHB-141]